MRKSPPSDYVDLFFRPRDDARSAPGIVDPSAEFLWRVTRLGAALEKSLAILCLKQGLTTAQFHALAALRRFHPEALNAGRLMQATSLSSGSVTPLVRQLTKKKLIERGRHTDDRRQVQIRLTGAGKTLIERLLAARDRELVKMAGLCSPREREALSTALKKLLVDLDPA